MIKDFITRNILLSGKSIEEKKDEVIKYFVTTYELFEKLFDIFIDDSVFYERPESLRHQLIFYFGHTSTFFINKLIVGKFIKVRVNSHYESIFAIGVDEMSWDDLNEENYDWPTVPEIKEYRAKVKEIIIKYIKNANLTLPIDWKSPLWPIIMGIEHEKIHIETSSVLHRQLDIKFIKKNSFWNDNECKEYGKSPKNSLIEIDGGVVELGKSLDSNIYGWDNEYGIYKEKVETFKASKYLVSNEEFLEFVNDGYNNNNYWSYEGLKWREYKKATHPTFWIKDNDNFLYRTLTEIIPLPLNWPVDVNFLEAEAFCNWKSENSGKNISLPTEAMWHRLFNSLDIVDEPQWKEIAPGNINLEYYTSSSPIDKFEVKNPNGESFFDVIGNVWQWTTTPISGFNDFKIHPLYDDFSVPTFDSRHNIFKGGSWISTGNETLKDSRYAFRRHFYQHAGFRYYEILKSKKSNRVNLKNNFTDIKQNSSQQDAEFYDKVIKISSDFTKNSNSALNLGCNSGYITINLAKKFKNIVGIDFTARNIQIAEKNREFDNVEFWQGDSCNLKPIFKNYDMIIATNNYQELYNFEQFLNNIIRILNKNGILILALSQLTEEGRELINKKLQSNISLIKSIDNITIWSK